MAATSLETSQRSHFSLIAAPWEPSQRQRVTPTSTTDFKDSSYFFLLQDKTPSVCMPRALPSGKLHLDCKNRSSRAAVLGKRQLQGLTETGRPEGKALQRARLDARRSRRRPQAAGHPRVLPHSAALPTGKQTRTRGCCSTINTQSCWVKPCERGQFFLVRRLSNLNILR